MPSRRTPLYCCSWYAPPSTLSVVPRGMHLLGRHSHDATWQVRVYVGIEEAMLAVLSSLQSELSPCYDEVLDEALPYLANLRRDFGEPAIDLLEHWIVQVQREDKSKCLRFVVFHAHLLLLHGNLFRGWPAAVVRALGERMVEHQCRERPAVLRMAPSMSVMVMWGESAMLEQVDGNKWLTDLIRGHALMPMVYALMQETRGEMLRATSSDEGSDEGRMAPLWFERTVAVARREQSGGEPFPPPLGLNGSSSAPDAEGWEQVGQPPIVCTRKYHSPGWKEGLHYPPSCDMYFEIVFPEATSITIRFDDDTELEEGSDFISFFESSMCTKHYGERRQLSGPRQVGWPGVAGVPVLKIDNDRCFVHFHSDASIGKRGFFFVAEAPVSLPLADSLLRRVQEKKLSDAAEARDDDDDEEEDNAESAQRDAKIDQLACQRALEVTNNNSRSAWAYLHSNYEKLHEEARKELSKSGSDSKTVPGSAPLFSSLLHHLLSSCCIPACHGLPRLATACPASPAALLAHPASCRRIAPRLAVFFNRHTKLQINMQTGEMVVGGRALLPVPSRVVSNEAYTSNMSREVPLCSILAVDDDGEWFQVAGTERAEKDGAEYDFFAHRARPAELPATLLAKRKKGEMREKMAQGMANLESESGSHKTAGERERHAARREVRQAIVGVLVSRRDELYVLDGQMADDLDDEMFANRLTVALESLGVAKLTDLTYLRESDDVALAELVPELKLPVHRRQLLSMLLSHTTSVDSRIRRRDARLHSSLAGCNEETDGPWLLGGLDERPEAPEELGQPSHGLLRQEEGGLRWCGHFFVPYRPHRERVVGEVLPAWQELFELKLYEELQKGVFFDVSNTLRLWRYNGHREGGPACPILMYCPALGDPIRCIGHPGQMWEIGPAHTFEYPSRETMPDPASSSDTFNVFALKPRGLYAYERTPVYSSDSNQALQIFASSSNNYSTSDNVDDAVWLPGFRNEDGILFGGLLNSGGQLVENRPGIGGLRAHKVRDVSVRRTRPSLQRNADQAALEAGGLGRLNVLEDWTRQQLVERGLLATLLPDPLSVAFSFWQSSETTIWGYRTQNSIEVRVEMDRLAQQRGKMDLYRTEWYDGYAIHIELIPQHQTALVRRLKWVSPLCDKEGEKPTYRSGEPACLTLINASRTAPGSTVRRLLNVFKRLAPDAAILFWTESDVRAPGDECTIHSIELPWYELRFMPREFWPAGASAPIVRYVCDDLKGMWLADEPNQPFLTKHLEGMPFGLWLENAEHEFALLMPFLSLTRRKKFRVRCMTDICADWNSSTVGFGGQHVSETGLRYFLYPLHASGCHLRMPSIAAALYLALGRLMSNQLEMVPPLIEAAFKDTPYDEKSEVPILRCIIGQRSLGGSNSPPMDEVACILPLELMVIENNTPGLSTTNLKGRYESYIAGLAHVSAACLIPPDVELRLCDRCGEAGRAAIIQAQMQLRDRHLDGEDVTECPVVDTIRKCDGVPPPKRKKDGFSLRVRHSERLQPHAGLDFWETWMAQVPGLLSKAEAYFSATPPGPPPAAPTVHSKPKVESLTLTWCAPSPADGDQAAGEAAAPVEGYLIEAILSTGDPLRSECTDAKFSSKEWRDVLSMLPKDKGPGAKEPSAKEPRAKGASETDGGDGCCTWSTETKWVLASDVLTAGHSYRFRVRAVNRLGVSEASEESAPIGLAAPTAEVPLPAANDEKPTTQPPGSRSWTSGVAGADGTLLKRWNYALAFHSANAAPIGEQVTQTFVNLTQEHGINAYASKMGFGYLYGLLIGQYKPWERLKDADGSLEVGHGARSGSPTVAAFDVGSDVQAADLRAALEQLAGGHVAELRSTKDGIRPTKDGMARVWYVRFASAEEAEAAVTAHGSPPVDDAQQQAHPRALTGVRLFLGNKLEQIKSEYNNRGGEDKVPSLSMFTKPILDEFELPTDPAGVSADTLMAVRLLLKGKLFQATMGKYSEPYDRAPMFALLSALVNAHQQIDSSPDSASQRKRLEKLLGQLPPFPLTQNRRAFAASYQGVRADRWQMYTFFKRAMACVHKLHQPVELLGGVMVRKLSAPPKALNEEGIESIATRWVVNVGGKSEDEHVVQTVKLFHLTTLRPVVSNTVRESLTLPTAVRSGAKVLTLPDGEVPTAQLLTLSAPAGLESSAPPPSSNAREALYDELRRPLHAFVAHTRVHEKQKADGQLRSFSMQELRAYAFDSPGHLHGKVVAQKFIERIESDLTSARTAAENDVKQVCLQDFGPAQVVTVALAAHALGEGLDVADKTLTLGAHVRGVSNDDVELTKMLAELKQGFPHEHGGSITSSDTVLLDAASAALTGLFSRLQSLRTQLRDTIGSCSVETSEICKIQSAIRAIELTVAPPLDEQTTNRDRQQLQILQACQQRMRPSFEHLCYSQLSSRQRQDLSAIDPRLGEAVGQVSTHLALAQARCTRLRKLGMASLQVADVEQSLLKVASDMLAALFEITTAQLSLAPPPWLLELTLRREKCDLGAAVKVLVATMQQLLSSEPMDDPHALCVGALERHFDTKPEALKAAYVVAHHYRFDLGRVRLETAGEVVVGSAEPDGVEMLSIDEIKRAVKLAERGLRWRGRPTELPPASWSSVTGEQMCKPAAVIDISILGGKAGAIAKEILYERMYIDELDGSNRDGVSLPPRLLAFEFAGSMMLRPQQAKLVRELRQSADDNVSRCQQMIMGGGKSAVIAPLLSLLLVDGQKLIVLIVPDALLDMSTNVTRGAFGPTIPTPVLNFAFERSGSDDMLRQLRQINRKLRFTRDKYGVICTTPGAIKSLFLTYIDRLHVEERVSPLLLLPRKVLTKKAKLTSMQNGLVDQIGKALATRAREAKLCRSVLGILKESIALIDEVDSVLHPLRSELNFPIGAKIPLMLARLPKEDQAVKLDDDNARYRWTLPLHLMDGVFAALDEPMGYPEMKSPQALEVIAKLKTVLKDGLKKCFVSRTPHVTLLQKAFYDEHMKPLIAEWALLWLRVQPCVQRDTASLPGRQAASGGWMDSKIDGREPGENHRRTVNEALHDFILGKPAERRQAEAAGALYLHDRRGARGASPSSPRSASGIQPLRMPPVRVPTRQAPVLPGSSAARHAPMSQTTISNGLPPPALPPPAVVRSEFFDIMYRLQGTQTLAVINLIRTQITSLLPHILSKRNRIDFGLLTDSDATRLKLIERDERMQRTGGVGSREPTAEELLTIDRASRELLAVPFAGKDAPSKAAEFAIPEVILGLTIAAYRISGLRDRDVRRLLSRLLLDFSRDAGSPYESRREYRLLNGWQDAAIESWARVHGEDSEPYEKMPLQMLQPGDKRHIDYLVTMIGKEPQAICYYLDEVVFNQTQLATGSGGGYASEKLSASGMDLGSDMIFKCSIGFSGTPSDLIPPAMKPCMPSPGDDAKTINVLTNPDIMSVDEMRSPWSSTELLRLIAQRGFKVLIDAGALITGMSNIQVAQAVLELPGTEWAKAAVYIDAQDRKQVVFKGGGPPIPEAQANVRPDERFTFYDQCHVVGMDIKQAVDARAACTLCKGMALRDFAQACWRMRQIESGQKVTIIMTPEVQTSVRDMAALAHSGGTGSAASGDAKDGGMLRDVMNWLLNSALEAEALMNAQLLVQSVHNVPRRNAIQWLCREEAFPDAADDDEEGKAASATGAVGDEAPVFTSAFLPALTDTKEQAGVLDEELPDVDAHISRMICELGIKAGGEEGNSTLWRTLSQKYTHITSTKEAVMVLSKNCAACELKGDANIGTYFDSPEELFFYVCSYSGLLRGAAMELFDPDESGSGKAKQERLMLLYQKLKEVDEKLLPQMDVPPSTFGSGGIFGEHARLLKLWTSSSDGDDGEGKGDAYAYEAATQNPAKYPFKSKVAAADAAAAEAEAAHAAKAKADQEVAAADDSAKAEAEAKAQAAAEADAKATEAAESAAAAAAFAKTLAPDMYGELLKRGSTPGLLVQCIRHAIVNPSCSLGVVAARREAFDAYRTLIEPQLRLAQPGLAESAPLIHPELSRAPKLSIAPTVRSWLDESNVELTSLTCKRNLQGMPFLATCEAKDLAAIEQLIGGVINSWQGGETRGVYATAFNGSYRKLLDLSEAEVAEVGFTEPGKDTLAHAAGAATDFPNHRGVYANKSSEPKVVLWVNECEHLHIKVSYKGCKLEHAFGCYLEVLARVQDALTRQKRPFEQHARLGWVGCNLAWIGAAFAASINLRLAYGAEDAAEDLGVPPTREAVRQALEQHHAAVAGRATPSAKAAPVADAEVSSVLVWFKAADEEALAWPSPMEIAKQFGLTLTHTVKTPSISKGMSETKARAATAEANSWWQLKTARCLGRSEADLMSDLIHCASALLRRDAVLTAAAEIKTQRAKEVSRRTRDERKKREALRLSTPDSSCALTIGEQTVGCIRLFREQLQENLLIPDTTAQQPAQSVVLREKTCDTYGALIATFPTVDTERQPSLGSALAKIRMEEEAVVERARAAASAGGAGDEAAEANLNTEMVQEQEQQQEQEEVAESKFGPWEDPIIEHASYWSPSLLAGPTDCATLRPFHELLAALGSPIPTALTKTPELGFIRYSPNWASSEAHGGTLQRRFRNITMFVRVRQGATTPPQYSIVTLAEAEALVRHFDSCSRRAVDSGALSPHDVWLRDAHVELMSLKGPILINHRPQAIGTSPVAAQHRQLDDTADEIGMRLEKGRSEVYALEKAVERDLDLELDAPVLARLKFWNNEFYFKRSELVVLLDALAAIGVAQGLKRFLFMELLKGRRRDKQQTELTPIDEVLVFDSSVELRRVQTMVTETTRKLAGALREDGTALAGEARLDALFREIDTDNSGSLSKSELFEVRATAPNHLPWPHGMHGMLSP